MRKSRPKKDLYFIQLNLQMIKHRDLIEWIKEQAELKEQSLSAFCIKKLKECKDEENSDGYGK